MGNNDGIEIKDYSALSKSEKAAVDQMVENYRNGVGSLGGISTERVMNYMTTLRLDEMNQINKKLDDEDKNGGRILTEERMKRLEAMIKNNSNQRNREEQLENEVKDLKREISELKNLLTQKLK